MVKVHPPHQPQAAQAKPAALSTTPVVTLERVSKRFGQVIALDDVSLTLPPGGVTAVLGPNGAGKTTLINLMLGLLRPSAGTVHLFGLHPQSRAARERVGVMLQVSGLPELLTVRELVRLFRCYYPAPLPLGEILELAGLVGLEARLYGTLSGGQKQRLHFALAICGNPKLLFLDEPTVGLDVELKQAFWRSITHVAARGCTVLFTTHHLDEADNYAQRVIVVDKGNVVADGTKTEIKARVAGKRVRFRTQLPPEALLTEPDVHAVKRAGGRLEILTDAPERLIPRLTALDPELSELEVDTGVLEEVYLSLIRSEGRV